MVWETASKTTPSSSFSVLLNPGKIKILMYAQGLVGDNWPEEKPLKTQPMVLLINCKAGHGGGIRTRNPLPEEVVYKTTAFTNFATP
jgi:hypothetical protein